MMFVCSFRILLLVYILPLNIITNFSTRFNSESIFFWNNAIIFLDMGGEGPKGRVKARWDADNAGRGGLSPTRRRYNKKRCVAFTNTPPKAPWIIELSFYSFRHPAGATFLKEEGSWLPLRGSCQDKVLTEGVNTQYRPLSFVCFLSFS